VCGSVTTSESRAAESRLPTASSDEVPATTMPEEERRRRRRRAIEQGPSGSPRLGLWSRRLSALPGLMHYLASFAKMKHKK
jgi:hypothetical protein